MGIDYTALGKRIRSVRTRVGLSQERLAEKVDLSISHVSNIENGSTKVALQTLTNIANALGATIDELLADSVIHSKVYFEKDLAEIVEDCDDYEIRVITEVAAATKRTLRRNERIRRGN